MLAGEDGWRAVDTFCEAVMLQKETAEGNRERADRAQRRRAVQGRLQQSISESQLEAFSKWLSCNGEIWGVGPTIVFASAAALFLYSELEATLIIPGDQARVSALEKTLISTMVCGMLALMIHIWVCSMRFFQYYLDTLIRDTPNIFLEMTTAGILGNQEIVPLGPLTRFLRQQQPQIHITFCWFLSLCYADYVRKHYCQRFNMPYLEQWQAELHERASHVVRRTIDRAQSFVGALHQRLRGYGPQDPLPQTHDANTGSVGPKSSSVEVSAAASKVSWGDVRCEGSSVHGVCVDNNQLSVRLVSQSSETTVDAIEKLRAFVAANKCPCKSPQSTSVGLSTAMADKPLETP